jgi:hypothetical protein
MRKWYRPGVLELAPGFNIVAYWNYSLDLWHYGVVYVDLGISFESKPIYKTEEDCMTAGILAAVQFMCDKYGYNIVIEEYPSLNYQTWVTINRVNPAAKELSVLYKRNRVEGIEALTVFKLLFSLVERDLLYDRR